MKLKHIASALALIAGLTGSVQASTLGFATTSSGYAYWDTFTSTTSYPTITITDAAPAGSSITDFSASLSVLMSGTRAGGGERLYSGTGATDNAFNFTINGVANSSFESFTIQLKATGPLQGVTLEDNIAPAGLHFTVASDSGWGTAARQYVTATTESGNTFYVYAWTWSGLDVEANDTFSIHVTSAVGHVSLDSIRVDASAIPEPSTYAALAGFGVLALAASRRRRAV